MKRQNKIVVVIFLLAVLGGVHASAAPRYVNNLGDFKSSPHCSAVAPKGVDPAFYKWPFSFDEAYHNDSKVYYKRKMFYCRGADEVTKDIVYLWPSWPFAIREDWNYPVQFVDTAGGVLSTRGRETTREVFLNGKVFIQNLDDGGFLQVLPEKSGKPEIVVMYLSRESDPVDNDIDAPSLRLIDMGVSPPYVSNIPMLIGNASPERKAKKVTEEKISLPSGSLSPHAWGNVDIQKDGEGFYIISGWTYGKFDTKRYPAKVMEKPAFRRYKYDRSKRSLSVLE